jgi:hypothetical protein
MSKQPSEKSPIHVNIGLDQMNEGRYYVQSLTAQVFIVRKCHSAGGKPGPNDRIIRSFEIHHDASNYADGLNSGNVQE